MATNKAFERFAAFQALAPAGINIASGTLLVCGHGKYAFGAVAQEAQNTTNPPYDSNSGYLTLDPEGAYNLSVIARTQSSPSAGAAINRFDPIFADGGTFDVTSGITYNNTLDADSSGTFIGLALDPLTAGTTGTIRVLLKNSSASGS